MSCAPPRALVNGEVQPGREDQRLARFDAFRRQPPHPPHEEGDELVLAQCLDRFGIPAGVELVVLVKCDRCRSHVHVYRSRLNAA